MTEEGLKRNSASTTGDHHDIRYLENGITSELLQGDTITAEEATNAAGVGIFQVKLVVLSGFVWMARGFELVMVLMISGLLTCKWNLRRWHGALLSTLTVISTILGCFFYGIWSDKYGRRMALSSSLILLVVFGAVSAGLPSYTWFLIFRVVAGFALGGLPQTLVLCCEYMPGRQRGRSIYILSCFWALGVVIMLSVLYATLDSESNWRIFVAVGALPAFFAMDLMRFFPESFRFLMVTDQYFAANLVMAEMTETNRKGIMGALVPLPPHRRTHLFTDVLAGPLKSAMALLWFMGFVTSISFMALTIVTPGLVLQGIKNFKPTNDTTMNFMGDIYSDIPCMKGMSNDQFIFMVWTTSLDFPAFIIYMILVDVIDRKKLLCVSYVLIALCIFLLFIETSLTVMYAVFIYCARTLLHGQFDLLLLIVAETFPTSHRGTAVGLEVAIFYIGQLLSSYIIQGLLRYAIMYVIILYGLLVSLCAVASVCLRLETRGKELTDTMKE